MKTFLICLALVVLSGCSGGREQDLQSYIDEVKSKSISQIEPLPEFKPYETFGYSAAALRSPFEQPKAVQNVVAAVTENGIHPDYNRRKEVLESYPLDSLKMVGTLEKNQAMWGIVVDPEGSVHRIAEGSYVGQNHGKILKVTEEKINIKEIIPENGGGWRERDAIMTLEE